MADIFHNGVKIGYMNKQNQFVPVNVGNNQAQVQINPYVYGQQTQSQRPVYKRSGAVYSKIRNGNFEGEIIVNAWKLTKLGMLKATVTPYAKNGGDKIVISHGKSGNQEKEYRKMICKITNDSVGTSQIYPVLMNIKTQVIVIKELSMCITPNGSGVTAKGKRVTGYFGRNYTTK